MSAITGNGGSASVKKSFVNQHKAELLLVVGLVASVALGLFVSPDIGIGLGAVTAFMYGAAKLLSPPSGASRKYSEHDVWDVNCLQPKKSAENVDVDPEFDQSVAEFKARPDVKAAAEIDAKVAAAKARREAARKVAGITSSPDRAARFANV